MTVRTIGGIALDSSLQGAVSVGPMLEDIDFTAHAINSDRSLGSKSPFLNTPLARIALYGRNDGSTHLCLFDGRPGSHIFPGVTPQQAVKFISDENEITWGCFLDPGQTAKLVVKSNRKLASYGNNHYLKWPTQPGERFIWSRKAGRPVGSIISFR